MAVLPPHCGHVGQEVCAAPRALTLMFPPSDEPLHTL